VQQKRRKKTKNNDAVDRWMDGSIDSRTAKTSTHFATHPARKSEEEEDEEDEEGKEDDDEEKGGERDREQDACQNHKQ
jgi:hypothetical protein